MTMTKNNDNDYEHNGATSSSTTSSATKTKNSKNQDQAVVVEEYEQQDDKNNDNKKMFSSQSCSCIQMSAIRIQTSNGAYIQTPLNMNTSRNVCNAIRLILNQMDEQQEHKTTATPATSLPPQLFGSVYLYTRPTILPKS